MKSLLVVTETLPEYETRIRATLVHTFSYRVHHMLDVADDMLSYLGFKPDSQTPELQYLRETLVKWNDAHPYHRHKFYNALWERARPLSRIGRAMAVMGLRESDLAHLLLRTTAEKVAVYTLRVAPIQENLFDSASTSTAELSPASLAESATTRETVRKALTKLGLL